MTTTLEVEPDDLRSRAHIILVLITEALTELDGLPPHPQRTLLGRHLLRAYGIAKAWQEDNNIGSSKGT